MFETKIISLGGSIVAPKEPDVLFIKEFKALIMQWLNEKNNRRLVFIVGGGAPARSYQNAYKEIVGEQAQHISQDWIGIMATRLNAQLIKAVFEEECLEEVVTDPSGVKSFRGRVLVGAGWKPGFSTDFDAVLLAENLQGTAVINLSNIAKVYDKDPKKHKDAQPIDKITWADFQKIVGTEWEPGLNAPFDPIATAKAKELGLHVYVAEGRNLKNLYAILNENEFHGTLISN